MIREIHNAYLEAGADIIETNTFNATSIAQSDYGLEGRVREINVAAAQDRARMRRRMDGADARHPALRRGRPRTHQSHRVDLARRQRSRRAQHQLRRARRPSYTEAIEGLAEGGADLFVVETIFDTLNGKAALFALETFFEAAGRRLPVIVSGTITDASGRTLSGQTTEAFWNSVRHVAAPRGRNQLLAGGRADAALHRRDVARRRHLRLVLPECGAAQSDGRDRLRRDARRRPPRLLEDFASNGFVNLVGGCCGTTPAHIRAIAEAVKRLPPRVVPGETGESVREAAAA